MKKRRFNDLLSEYTNIKYKNVFIECKELYESLNKAHPNKHDLTKTTEFKSWKTLLQTGNSSVLIETGQPSTPSETEQSSAIVRGETEHPLPSPPNKTEQPPSSTPSNEAEQPLPSPPNETEQPPSSTPSNEAEQPLPSPPNETEQPPSSTPSNEAGQPLPSPPNEIEQPPSSIPSNEAGQNILQIAAEDLIPLSPQINIDNVIDDIIQDLQRDDDIWDSLDEDEGIGLNVETEIEGVIEPFDYQVEVW